MVKMRNVIRTILAAALLVIMMSANAFAADYTISWLGWDDANGAIKASWNEAKDETDYYVQLYKGSPDYGGNRIGGQIKVKYGKDSHNFTSAINDNGGGTYYFTIWAAKDASGSGSNATPNVVYRSDAYQVTEETLVYYRPNNRGWQFIEGSWYLYSDKGEVLTGWQLVNDKWYYMDPAGRCLLDTITPDGYRVDPSGAWDGQPKVV